MVHAIDLTKNKFMKLFKILSHPYTLIICFSLILISGEQWGGFYAFYLLLALPYGGVHSLLALAGFFSMLASLHWVKDHLVLQQVLNVVGVFFLVSSLYYFFDNDKLHYNWGTFQEPVPLSTLIITICVGICFLIGTFVSPSHSKAVMV
jgi:hypothetical protein